MRKIITVLFVLSLFVLLASSVLADSKLKITDITVKVNGDRKSADENGGTIKVPPESRLTLKVRVENLYAEDIDGSKIRNVDVEGVLKDIDDGDDLDDTSDDKDLNAGRDAAFNIAFDIPLRIDSDETYTLTVTARGKDENGTEMEDEVEFDVEADKESHEIRFLREEIAPSTISCSRTAVMNIGLINTGENDEDVELYVENSALGYFKQDNFELVSDINDDDNEYEFEDTLNLADAKPGTYPFDILVKYRDGREVLDKTLNLVVDSCETAVAETSQPEEPKSSAQSSGSSQTTQTATDSYTQTTSVPTQTYVPPSQPSGPVQVVSNPQTDYRSSAMVATPKTSYSSKSWWDKYRWYVLIGITDLILLGVGIAVVLSLLNRRRN